MPVDKSPDFGFFLVPRLEEFDWDLGGFSSLRPGERKEVISRFIWVVITPSPEGRFKLIGIDRLPWQSLSNAILNAPCLLSQDLQGGPVVIVRDGWKYDCQIDSSHHIFFMGTDIISIYF